MKTVLCYGDSNTYGYNPSTGGRYASNQRWTGVLAKLLKDECCVIEEGLNGRVTNYNDKDEPFKNGLTYLVPCLLSHRPIDYMTIMLGTNDCKTAYNRSIEEIALGIEELIITTKKCLLEKQGYLPKIIIIVPPAVNKNIVNSVFSYEMGLDGVEKSKALAPLYEKIAIKHDCLFIDGVAKLKTSSIDSEHMSVKMHKKLAELVASLINIS